MSLACRLLRGWAASDFGAPIGSFQALQHRAAHMFTEIELCSAAVDSEPAMLAFKASLAKALANDCYELVSNEAVQMHGGMGTTDEFDIGLFLKRARVSMQMLGDAAFHRARYAELRGFRVRAAACTHGHASAANTTAVSAAITATRHGHGPSQSIRLAWAGLPGPT
jgi:alkylation response protein AidB-like acyl-CoA dehydrogenase